LLLWVGQVQGVLAAAVSPADLLQKADEIKLNDYGEVVRLLKVLDDRQSELTAAEREYLDYLHGWDGVYKGDFGPAIKKLATLQDTAKDPTVRFRAGATVVNALALHKDYDAAYSRLNSLLSLLPQVTNGGARQQGLLIGTYLYNEVGQFKQGLRLAQTVIDENWAGKGACRGGQVKLQALYRSHKLRQVGPELQAGLDACARSGDVVMANALRVDAGRLYLQNQQYDEVIALLMEHYDDMVKTHFRRHVAEYDALLAKAYRGKAARPMARKHALDVIQNADANEFTESLADAYDVMYTLAKDEGDFKSALAFHEQYAVAHSGYVGEDHARYLAFERANHANAASQLQNETQDQEYRVAQLERELRAETVQTRRLYIAMLVLAVLLVAFWAYSSKRSQVRFMSFSRFDG
jgi:hypothetical protein